MEETLFFYPSIFVDPIRDRVSIDARSLFHTNSDSNMSKKLSRSNKTKSMEDIHAGILGVHTLPN
jgi:hypothetical protein